VIRLQIVQQQQLCQQHLVEQAQVTALAPQRVSVEATQCCYYYMHELHVKKVAVVLHRQQQHVLVMQVL
jgi:hypothetical protein